MRRPLSYGGAPGPAVPGRLPGAPPAPYPPVPPEARWLVAADAPWQQVVGFGPPGFAATARLRFVPDPERPGQAEAEVQVGPDHLTDLEQTERALQVLATASRSSHDCWSCLWDGWPCPALPQAAAGVVVLPHRRYRLYRSPLSRVAGLVGRPGCPPAFVWPADRAWCLAADVDPHWAGIGASRAAVDALLSDPHLDVVEADPAAPQPAYR